MEEHLLSELHVLGDTKIRWVSVLEYVHRCLRIVTGIDNMNDEEASRGRWGVVGDVEKQKMLAGDEVE